MRFSPSWTLWSAALLLPPLTTAFINPLASRQLDTSFDWTAITPTPDLQYHSCYNDTFRCARLRVPLDWSKPNTSESGPFAAIALVTLPATVNVTSPSYAGPILINPGGPGGSGTQTVCLELTCLFPVFFPGSAGLSGDLSGIIVLPGLQPYSQLTPDVVHPKY